MIKITCNSHSRQHPLSNIMEIESPVGCFKGNASAVCHPNLRLQKANEMEPFCGTTRSRHAGRKIQPNTLASRPLHPLLDT